MNRLTARGLALAGLLTLALNPFHAHAQDGFWGGGDSQTPSLTIAAAEIALDVPMPVNGGNLQLLLAQAGQGAGLSALKDELVRGYQQHLNGELAARLHEHFTDEEVPLLREGGALTLRNYLDITVIKHLSDLQAKGDYDLERGTVELSGDFHFRLENAAGATLREQRVGIAALRIREKYQMKTPRTGGEAEDNTEQAIKLALSRMLEEVIERVEDNLEADELRDLARGS